MLDYFDLAREYNHDPVAAFSHAKCKFLVVSFLSYVVMVEICGSDLSSVDLLQGNTYPVEF